MDGSTDISNMSQLEVFARFYFNNKTLVSEPLRCSNEERFSKEDCFCKGDDVSNIYIYIYGKTVSIAANEVTALLTDLGLPPF